MSTPFDYIQLAKVRDGLLFSTPLITKSTKPMHLNKKLELITKQIDRFNKMANSLILKLVFKAS